MRRKIFNILFGLMFLVGFLVLAYPTIADQWNTFRQQQLISNYDTVLEEMEPEDLSGEWEAAIAYNNTFAQNDIYGDVFGTDDMELEDTEYWKVLNIAGDGVMGYLTIPKIHVELSIYHGTSDEVLETGVGHMNGTKLPIGGESTHSVLSAHRGLPSAKLFTDLELLELGDRFTLYILGEQLTYEVDSIQTVLPDQLQSLSIQPGEDLVTLMTCTPYGINTHRLLVRGHRVEDVQAAAASAAVDTAEGSRWMREYRWVLGGVILLAAAAGVGMIWHRKRG